MSKNKNETARDHSVSRKRKFFMALPLVVIPFVLLFSWALGLAGPSRGSDLETGRSSWLNATLPQASPKQNDGWDKLSFYEQADKDSAKYRAMLKNDPYRKAELAVMAGEVGGDLEETRHGGFKYSYDPYPSEAAPEVSERKVYEKLAELDTALKSGERAGKKKRLLDTVPLISTLVSEAEVQKLENMMRVMGEETARSQDEEMVELKEMLHTILDIQHPERVEERMRARSAENRRRVLPVEKEEEGVVSLLEPARGYQHLLAELAGDSVPETFGVRMSGNRFYGLGDETVVDEGLRALRAVVHEDQTLVSGATVKLRLMDDVYVAGARVPNGRFVYGQASLRGERLEIAVTSIGYGDRILPVSLKVYDQDRLPGIHIPGAITRDVAKRSAGQSMQGLGSLNTLNPSVGAQAVTAGMQMAQQMVGKAARLVRVSVPAGYQVLLVDEEGAVR